MTDFDKVAEKFAYAADLPLEDAIAIILSVADALEDREQNR